MVTQAVKSAGVVTSQPKYRTYQRGESFKTDTVTATSGSKGSVGYTFETAGGKTGFASPSVTAIKQDNKLLYTPPSSYGVSTPGGTKAREVAGTNFSTGATSKDVAISAGVAQKLISQRGQDAFKSGMYQPVSIPANIPYYAQASTYFSRQAGKLTYYQGELKTYTPLNRSQQLNKNKNIVQVSPGIAKKVIGKDQPISLREDIPYYLKSTSAFERPQISKYKPSTLFNYPFITPKDIERKSDKTFSDKVYLGTYGAYEWAFTTSKDVTLGIGKQFYIGNYIKNYKPKIDIGQTKYLQIQGSALYDPQYRSALIAEGLFVFGTLGKGAQYSLGALGVTVGGIDIYKGVTSQNYKLIGAGSAQTLLGGLLIKRTRNTVNFKSEDLTGETYTTLKRNELYIKTSSIRAKEDIYSSSPYFYVKTAEKLPYELKITAMPRAQVSLLSGKRSFLVNYPSGQQYSTIYKKGLFYDYYLRTTVKDGIVTSKTFRVNPLTQKDSLILTQTSKLPKNILFESKNLFDTTDFFKTDEFTFRYTKKLTAQEGFGVTKRGLMPKIEILTRSEQDIRIQTTSLRIEASKSPYGNTLNIGGTEYQIVDFPIKPEPVTYLKKGDVTYLTKPPEFTTTVDVGFKNFIRLSFKDSKFYTFDTKAKTPKSDFSWVTPLKAKPFFAESKMSFSQGGKKFDLFDMARVKTLEGLNKYDPYGLSGDRLRNFNIGEINTVTKTPVFVRPVTTYQPKINPEIGFSREKVPISYLNLRTSSKTDLNLKSDIRLNVFSRLETQNKTISLNKTLIRSISDIKTQSKSETLTRSLTNIKTQSRSLSKTYSLTQTRTETRAKTRTETISKVLTNTLSLNKINVKVQTNTILSPPVFPKFSFSSAFIKKDKKPKKSIYKPNRKSVLFVLPDLYSVSVTEAKTGREAIAPKLTPRVERLALSAFKGFGRGFVPTEQIRRGLRI